MIKRLVLAAVLGVSLVGGASVAWADCYFETYTINGKTTTCTICVTGMLRTVTCN
jgi:hypothetical protein